MKFHLRFFILFFTGLYNFNLFSQNTYSLPQLTPQSPNVASLGKYGDVPVSLGNGMANVSIPLYTIKVGSFELPVTLSYHNNGLKVDEIPSYVGLGWDIQAGGTITCEQRGNNDFDIEGVGMFTTTFINPSSRDSLKRYLQNQMNSTDKYNYLESVMRGDVDAEFDLFHFNFLGYSGSFYFDMNQNIVCVPKSNLKIYKLDGGFEFIDEKGNQYYFGASERNKTSPWPEGTVSTRKSFSDVASYQMATIITAENRQIRFGYADFPFSYQKRTWYLSHYPVLVNAQPSLPCGTNSLNTYLTNFELQNSLLGSITFDEGALVFDFSDDIRKDITKISSAAAVEYLKDIRLVNNQNQLLNQYSFKCSYFGDSTRLKLDSVVRLNNSLNTIQKWKFDYYSPDLVPVCFINGKDHWGYYNGGNNPNEIPDADYQLFVPTWQNEITSGANRNSNFNYSIAGVLSKITYPTGGQTTFLYEPNQIKFKNVEELINNPFFINSSNKSNYGGYVDVASGNTDYDGDIITGSFTLDVGQVVNVLAVKYIDPFNFVRSNVSLSTTVNGTNILDQALSFHCAFTNCTASQDIYLDAGTYYYSINKNLDADENPVDGHASLAIAVFKYDTAAPPPFAVGGCRIASVVNTDSLGKTTKKKYRYSDGSDSVIFRNIPYYISINQNNHDYSTAGGGILICYQCSPEYRIQDESVIPMSGNPIEYLYVTELDDETGINGKTDYVFTGSDNLNVDGGSPYIPPFISTWRSGLVANKKIFKNTGDGYMLISKDSASYEGTYPPDSVTYGVRAEYWVYCDEEGPDNRQLVTNRENYQTERFDQKSSTQALYDNSGNIASTVSYSYSSTKHTLPTAILHTTSKNEMVTDKTIYSFDYDTTHCTDTASIAIRNLQRRNALVPIEKLSIKTINSIDYVIAGILMTYRTGATVPSAVYRLKIAGPVPLSGFTVASINSSGVFTQDSRYEQKAEFNAYDGYNNPLQNHYTANTFLSYLWDYKSLHLIAEVKNATQTDIAYTSFEADGTGNWTIGSASRDTTSGFTGTKSFSLNSDISRSGLTSTTTYIVSYWTRNTSPFTITGTITGYPVKGKTITYNNTSWTLYTHRVTGQTTIALSGSGPIDELRLYPLGAQMTTYTYTPLVGMTSQTDMGNRVTYYEYDGLQRLMRIRDQDHNILKSLEYQYQTSSGCGPNCYSITMQTLAGTNTLGYPVGVFDVHGNLLGNATGPVQYVSLWNADTANARIGTLSTGSDSLHFSMTLNTGMTLPSGVTGCRYYQVDLTWSNIDGVRNTNGAYIDFGDSTGMRMPANSGDTAKIIAPNTTYTSGYSFELNSPAVYYIHTYPNTNQKTLTFYHNDAAEHEHLDNQLVPATSLTRLKNLRGNLPQNTFILGGSCYQDSSMTSLTKIPNWNSIHTVQLFRFATGDGINSSQNISYPQDFMKNNNGLSNILTCSGYYFNSIRDTSFRLSRLKSDWNTYFTNLQHLQISDEHWNREDLTSLTQLNYFQIWATTQNHQNGSGNPLSPIPDSVINNIIIQIANGAGQTVSNGAIDIESGGISRTSDSDDAVRLLLSKGWVIAINGVLQHI